MSVESAKAFCVRMMSDEDFRNAVGAAGDAAGITAVIGGEYAFTREEFLKGVSEMAGKKVPMEELKAMICEVYEEEIKVDGKGSADAVSAWLDSLA